MVIEEWSDACLLRGVLSPGDRGVFDESVKLYRPVIILFKCVGHLSNYAYILFALMRGEEFTSKPFFCLFSFLLNKDLGRCGRIWQTMRCLLCVRRLLIWLSSINSRDGWFLMSFYR